MTGITNILEVRRVHIPHKLICCTKKMKKTTLRLHQMIKVIRMLKQLKKRIRKKIFSLDTESI